MIFVTDRTEEDVLLGNEKGVYSAKDLNRVESNVRELAELVEQISVLIHLETKTDWGEKEQWMDRIQADRYLQNVKDLVSACGIDIVLPDSLSSLDCDGANNIEKALEMVNNKLFAITSTFNYSGEIFAGEEFSL